MERTEKQNELLFKWGNFIQKVPTMTVTEGDKYLNRFIKQAYENFEPTEADQLTLGWAMEYGKVTPSNPYGTLPF